MMNRRRVYTEGELAKRYYSVKECPNGFGLVEGSKRSSYSSRYEGSDESYRTIFMIILLLSAYMVIFGLGLIG